jgi:G3E family GTPase
MDHLHTLNDLTPKLRCKGREGVSHELIFGLDTKLYSLAGEESPKATNTHMDEVETCTLWRGTKPTHNHNGFTNGDTSCCTLDHSVSQLVEASSSTLTRQNLEVSLSALPKESIYRVKGFISLLKDEKPVSFILNWAFGRFDLIPVPNENPSDLRLTVMGERGEVKRWAKQLAANLEAHLD